MTKNMNYEIISLISNKANFRANKFYKKLGYECENGYVKFLYEEYHISITINGTVNSSLLKPE